MKSYRPEELFDDGGRLRPELADLAPRGTRRMSANPHANGGLLLRDLRLPDFRDYAVPVPAPGAATAEATRVMGDFLRDVMKLNVAARNFRLVSPDENNSNRWQDVLEVTDRAWAAEIYPWDDHLAPDGRVMEMLSEHQCQGWLEGYLLTGRHGFFSCYEAFIHIVEFDVQPARQMAEGVQPHSLAATDRVAELPAVQPRLAAGSQRLQPPGPRLHRPRGQQEGRGRPRLSAAGRQLPALGHRSLPAQPELRQRHRRRQAARAAMADHGPGGQALRCRARDLGVGEQRPGRGARRRDGLLRRRADAGDARRRRDAARARARAEDPGHQHRGSDEAAARRASIRTASRTTTSIRCSPRTSRSSSPSTAIRG